jgi:hypothetical protein
MPVAIPLMAGFNLGVAFTRWSFHRFDAGGWTALAFGSALYALVLISALSNSGSQHREAARDLDAVRYQPERPTP